jgi:short subunit dehydrogenase-like uncharacterized protein
MSKILVFGATGYTGDLTARRLVADGERPTLVARRAEPLKALADELGGLDVAVADAADRAALAAVVEPGDVLIATVGPFMKHGRTAAQVAAETGAHYLDSTGEGTFIREVFERWGPIAAGNGAGMLSAFGFDYVPGSLAGAMALEKAGTAATRVDVGYFAFHVGTSGGTKASIAGMTLEEGFAWRDGALQPERAGRRIERFDVGDRSMTGLSIPGAEHLALPASYPHLRDVRVFLGLPPAAARLAAAGALASTSARRIAPLKRVALAAVGRVVKGSTGGPNADARARARCAIVAVARSGAGEVLATTTLRGPDPYDYTAGILAWGARTAAAGGLQAVGGLGPVEAFGLEALEAGCAEAGLVAD